MITNNPTRVNRTEILPGISDHEIVLCELDISPTMNKQVKRSIPLYRKADWELLSDHIKNIEIKILNSPNSSVEYIWNIFKNELENGVNKCIPHKTASTKAKLPWITPEIKHLMRRRDRVYKSKLKTGSEHYNNIFKTLKAEIQRKLRRSYWDYIQELITPDAEGTGDRPSLSKRFYSYLKNNKTDKNGIASLRDEGLLHSNPRDKAQILNKQFQSVFTPESALPLSALAQSILPSPYPDMPEIQVNEPGILKLLQNLKPHKAGGPDNIKPIILKQLAIEIAPILTFIFNTSLETGEVPSDWRNANVVPIYKKGSRYNASNYRPISLTCICCKILEHVIATAIMKHSDINNILSPFQHGFRRNRSCETQLLQFTTDIANILAADKQTDVLVMDFSKAFDKVGHGRLLHKLGHYGIRGRTQRWIQGFLSGRTQEVVVEGQHSDRVPVTSGVPQGSVLGPCLFLHYINDLPEGIGSTVRLFADDTVMYLTIASQTDSHKLQTDLNNLAKWEKRWQMQFHPDKCQVLRITNKRNPIIFNYTLHDHILATVTQAKYLGVTITKDLNWKQHVENISKSANKALGFLRRNLRINSVKAKEQAYLTYVRPILEYSCTVWDPYRIYQQRQLEMVQRRAARFVCNRYRQTSSVTNMMAGLDWEPLIKRRRAFRMIMFYKMHSGLVAIHPTLYLTPRQYHTSHKYYIPHSRIDQHAFSFFPSTVRLWNKLSATTAQAPSLNAFKARVALL